jgi:hypothetical protein
MNFGFSDGPDDSGFTITRSPRLRQLPPQPRIVKRGFRPAPIIGRNRGGLGILPVAAAPVIAKVAPIIAEVSFVKSAVNAVKSIFGKKEKVYKAGQQRKYSGYMQEFQEGRWWYIPQWERELYSRNIVMSLAEKGYAATSEQVNAFFYDKYDAIISGRHPGFTGPQIPWGPGPQTSVINGIVKDFLATLPKGSTLPEQEQILADATAQATREYEAVVTTAQEKAAKAASDAKAISDAQVAAQVVAQAAISATANAQAVAALQAAQAAAQTAEAAKPSKNVLDQILAAITPAKLVVAPPPAPAIIIPALNYVPVTPVAPPPPAPPDQPAKIASVASQASALMAGIATKENIGRIAAIAVPLILIGFMFSRKSQALRVNSYQRR